MNLLHPGCMILALIQTKEDTARPLPRPKFQAPQQIPGPQGVTGIESLSVMVGTTEVAAANDIPSWRP